MAFQASTSASCLQVGCKDRDKAIFNMLWWLGPVMDLWWQLSCRPRYPPWCGADFVASWKSYWTKLILLRGGLVGPGPAPCCIFVWLKVWIGKAGMRHLACAACANFFHSWTFASDVDFKSDLQDDFQDRAWGYSHMLIRILSSLLVCLAAYYLAWICLHSYCHNPKYLCKFPVLQPARCPWGSHALAGDWFQECRQQGPCFANILLWLAAASKCQRFALTEQDWALDPSWHWPPPCRHVPKQLCWRMSCAKSNLMSRARRCPIHTEMHCISPLFWCALHSHDTGPDTRFKSNLSVYRGCLHLFAAASFKSIQAEAKILSACDSWSHRSGKRWWPSIHSSTSGTYGFTNLPLDSMPGWWTWTRHRTQCESAGLYRIVLRLSHAWFRWLEEVTLVHQDQKSDFECRHPGHSWLWTWQVAKRLRSWACVLLGAHMCFSPFPFAAQCHCYLHGTCVLP